VGEAEDLVAPGVVDTDVCVDFTAGRPAGREIGVVLFVLGALGLGAEESLAPSCPGGRA